MYPIILTYADLSKAIKIEYTIEKTSDQIKLSWTTEGDTNRAEVGEFTQTLQNEESTLLEVLHYIFNFIIPLSEYAKATNFVNKDFLNQKLALDTLFRIIERHEEIISLNEVIEYAYVDH
jgi:hypothetical protein